MDMIGVMDFVAFLAIMIAIIILWRGWQRAFKTDAKLLFAGFLVLSLFHNLSNVLEWSGITAALDPFEDYIQISARILWVFFFYVLLKDVEVAERKRVEEALSKSEERYTRLFEVSHDALFVVNLQAEFQDANPAALALVGYSMDELWKMKVDDLLAPGGGHSAEEHLRDWHESRLEEILLRHKDGHYMSVELSISPVQAQRGQQFAMGLARDITDRVRAEAERKLLLAQISAQAKQIQQTIDTVPEGVLLVDKAQCVILANPVAEKDLLVLAGAKVGDILTRLGDHPLAELLTSPLTEGLWHEVQNGGQDF